MKIFFGLFQASLATYFIMHVYSEICEVTRCASDNMAFNDSQCIYYHNQGEFPFNEVKISQCNSTNQMCPLPSGLKNQTCVDKYEPWNSFPGFPCTLDEQCWSKLCDKTKQVCLGKGEQKSCINSNECATGLFCQNNTACVTQLAENANCTDSYDCQNDMGCYNGNCRKYFSLPTGTKVDPQKGERLFCKSYYARDGMCVESKLKSKDQCSGDQTTCDYSYSVEGQAEQNYTISCKCTKSHSNNTYCQYGSESSPYKNELVPALKSWYSGDSKKKHTLMRHPNYNNKELTWKIYQIDEYPTFKDADTCVRGLFASSNFIQFISAISIFLAALLF